MNKSCVHYKCWQYDICFKCCDDCPDRFACFTVNDYEDGCSRGLFNWTRSYHDPLNEKACTIRKPNNG